MGKLKKPELNRKKIVIIAAVIAVVCLSASAGLYYAFKVPAEPRDDFGRRRRQWHDANMPNPDKQNIKDILAYRDSDAFKRLSQAEQFMYTMASTRQLREYEMQTYFTLPKEKQTAYLDKVIDDMQAQRATMEQMRQNRPPRPPRDANDPNVQARMAARAARRAHPSNARARSERGTALQQAQREQFRAAMDKRMKERGITPPTRGPGGPGGGPGGRGQ